MKLLKALQAEDKAHAFRLSVTVTIRSQSDTFMIRSG